MLKVVITLVRREEMTHEEFLAYWREEHAPLAEQLPNLRRYTMSEPVAEDTPFDGIAQLYYDDMDDFRKSMESEAAERVSDDSENYTDPDAGGQRLVRETVRLDDT